MSSDPRRHASEAERDRARCAVATPRSVALTARRSTALAPKRGFLDKLGMTGLPVIAGLAESAEFSFAFAGARGGDGLREVRAKPQGYDAAARRKLWELTESLVRDRA